MDTRTAIVKEKNTTLTSKLIMGPISATSIIGVGSHRACFYWTRSWSRHSCM